MRNFLACTVLAMLCCPAQAEDALPNYAQETLSGDWGGKRSELYKRGVELNFGYKGDWLRNSAGGASQNSHYMWLGDIKLKLDGEKLFGWSNTTAYFNVQSARGGKLNAQNTGSVMGVDNAEVQASATKLFHAWVDKGFADGKFSVLAGLYPMDSEFYVTDASGLFLHPSYGISTEIASTSLGNGANGRAPSIFNSSSLGLRFKLQPSLAYYAQVAINDGVPVNPGKYKGVHANFERGDGVFAIAEMGVKPSELGFLHAGDKKFEGVSKLAWGMWKYNPRFDDWTEVDASGRAQRRTNRGAYVIAEQTVGAGLSVFFRHGIANSDVNLLDSSSSIGFNVKGMFACRPDDIFGIATTHGRASSKYRQAQLSAGNAVDAYEQVIEVTYRAQITPWLAVQPNFQHIANPGLNPAYQNAKVYGARAEVAF